MERTYVSELKPGKSVFLKGWIHEIRNLSNMKFILLRDSSGIVQCVVKKGKKGFGETGIESLISVRGRTKSAKLTNKDLTVKNIEVDVSELGVINWADELPMQVNEKAVRAELPTRLDYRYLDIRKPKVAAIFKIQSVIINAFREFFSGKGFIEIQPPGIIATSTEGGTDLFEVKYFDRKAYLAQSPQLYKQLAAISLEKVFSTSTVWRAEKHDTSKHINEVRQMDIEVAFADDKEIMKWLEDCVKFIVSRVLKECKFELDLLKINLKIPKVKYLTYKEAIGVLNRNGFKLKPGDDFEPEAERKLSQLFSDTLIFTYEWPSNMKPFYIWTKDAREGKGVSGGFDVVYGGVEISSGGQRVHIPEILISQLRKKGLNPDNFKWYVDAFRYGAPEHAGWSIGLERLTQAMLGLDNIREATLFPRDRRRLMP